LILELRSEVSPVPQIPVSTQTKRGTHTAQSKSTLIHGQKEDSRLLRLQASLHTDSYSPKHATTAPPLGSRRKRDFGRLVPCHSASRSEYTIYFETATVL